MKEGWEVKALGEIANVEYGFTAKSTNEGDYRYIRITDINNNGELIIDEKKYIKYSNEAKNFILKDSDLLMARTGATFAKVLLYKDYEESIFASYLIRINFREKIENKLYWYFSKSDSYWIQAKNLSSGSAQPHFNGAALRQVNFSYPKSLSEQKQIVNILDHAFEAIDQAKANLEKNIENAKELFDSKKEVLFEKLALEYEPKVITEACLKIFAGGDAPKNNYSKERTEEFNIPIIANAVKNNGLYGYTNVARVTNPSITIAARGSGTGHTEHRDYHFSPIVRLIVLIPDPALVEVEFLMYAIKNLTILRSGSAIPQLTVPMIKGYSIPIPNLDIQIEIVEILNDLDSKLADYTSKLQNKLSDIEELKKSILQKAFAGELTGKELQVEV